MDPATDPDFLLDAVMSQLVIASPVDYVLQGLEGLTIVEGTPVALAAAETIDSSAVAEATPVAAHVAAVSSTSGAGSSSTAEMI